MKRINDGLCHGMRLGCVMVVMLLSMVVSTAGHAQSHTFCWKTGLRNQGGLLI